MRESARRPTWDVRRWRPSRTRRARSCILRWRVAPERLWRVAPETAAPCFRTSSSNRPEAGMSIKSDNWIRRMAAQHHMIEPFEGGQVRQVNGERIVSYGTSSYGYDVRCANEFKIFTNINSTIVDPKHFDEKSFVDVKADVCLIPPNSFALARTVEYFRIPRSVLTVCLGKSTYARCFAADTRVALVDGGAPTLEEMAGRSASGELFWGYSLGAHGRI